VLFFERLDAGQSPETEYSCWGRCCLAPYPAMLPSLLVIGFLSFLESRPLKMGPTRCPETSVNNYHTTPCNHPKDHRLRGNQVFESVAFRCLSEHAAKSRGFIALWSATSVGSACYLAPCVLRTCSAADIKPGLVVPLRYTASCRGTR
jgi:hypothetical protein